MRHTRPKSITHTHSDILITYDADNNIWKYEIEGKERSSASLKDAMNRIDTIQKLIQKGEKKPFKPIHAWMCKGYYDNEYTKVTITSIADTPSYQTQQVWISHNGKRSKESADIMVADTPDNIQRISAIKKLEEEVNKLDGRIAAEKKKLKKVELPKQDDGE